MRIGWGTISTCSKQVLVGIGGHNLTVPKGTGKVRCIMLSERKRLTDKVSTLADVYAPVSLRPVKVDGQEVANKRAVVIENDKTQKPETVSVQSANYKLWSNAVVKDAMDDIMTRSEWGWRHSSWWY